MSCATALLLVLWLLMSSTIASPHPAACGQPESRPPQLVFVGDSVTRFQYLSLVFFLEFGHWPGRYPDEVDPTTLYNRFQVWELFQWVTNALFEDEACDCFKTRGQAGFMVDNRYYRNKELGVRAHFHYFGGDAQGPKGHAYHPPAVTLPCIPGNCSHPADWVVDVPALLLYVLPLWRPTHVVLNVGIWHFRRHADPAFWADMCRASQALRARFGTQFLWAATTPKRDRLAHPGAQLPRGLAACGWRLFDRWNLTLAVAQEMPYDEMFLDNWHFVSDVYTHLNRAFLKIIGCPIPERPVSRKAMNLSAALGLYRATGLRGL